MWSDWVLTVSTDMVGCFATRFADATHKRRDTNKAWQSVRATMVSPTLDSDIEDELRRGVHMPYVMCICLMSRCHDYMPYVKVRAATLAEHAMHSHS